MENILCDLINEVDLWQVAFNVSIFNFEGSLQLESGQMWQPESIL